MPTVPFRAGSAYVGQQFLGASSATIGGILGGAAARLIKNYAAGSSSNRTTGGTFDVGSDIEITDQHGRVIVDNVGPRRRRRRRRLLTAADKADIAFLVGQLGTGQAGKAAISSLLARTC